MVHIPLYSKRTKFLFQIIILLAISYYITEIPVFIFRGSAWRAIYYMLVPLAIVILLQPYSNGILPRPRISGNAFFIFIAPFCLFIFTEIFVAGISGNGMTEVRSVAIIILTLSIVLLFGSYVGSRTDPGEGFRFVLKPYAYCCLFISATGFTAWLLVVTGVVSMESWDIRRFIDFGSIYRKSGYGARHVISMPFFLGFIDMGMVPFINIHRAAGWSFEPHIAALFVTPSLFVVKYVFPEWSRRRLIASYSIIGAFLVSTWTLTNQLIGAFLLVLAMLGSKASKIIFVCIALAGVLLLYMPLENDYVSYLKVRFDDDASVEVSRSNLAGLFSAESVLGYGVIQGKVDGGAYPGAQSIGMLSQLAVSIQFIIPLCAALALFFSKKDTRYFGLGLMYVLLHSLKDISHTVQLPFYFFILLITAMAYSVPNRDLSAGPRHVTDQSVKP